MLAGISGWHTAENQGVNNVLAAQDSFKNPIADGADPWVIKSGEYYYTCRSKAGQIMVSKSKKLTEIGPAKVVWKSPVKSWNSKTVWAPELHQIGKKWYIYYAAGQSGPPFIYQRSGVLESVTDDPQGEYVDKGMLKTGDDNADPSKTIWAIDLTVTSINGKLYAAWSGWERNATTDKTSQHLYIARMSNPVTISSQRVKISSPDQPWERGGPLDLNEGPQFLKNKGNTFIIYSARESWTPEYRLGQLKLKDSTRVILDAKNWIKSGPVFQGTPQVLGTGHASFTTSPDGKEWWIFYHSKKESSPGWNRDLRLQQFSWDAKGNPVFGIPVVAGTLIKKPGGE
ncbi:glycoside hydrolase family 43 protein [Daejeonella sp.]|uniref:glycoside hydrolase family 43 protein n=1 Tax=Daejeonella sp. TaxID=2805397 RepID=UPI0030BBE115